MFLRRAHVKTDLEREQCVAMWTAAGRGCSRQKEQAMQKPYDRNTSKYSRNSKEVSMMPPQ